MSPRKGLRRTDDPTQGGKRAALAEPVRAPVEGLAETAAAYEAEPESEVHSLAQGSAVLTAALPHLPTGPGVYRMQDAKGEVLYVGKAKSVRRRVYSYTQVAKLPRRLQRMVAATASVEVVGTGSEVEALLLESNLIKRYLPRFNVLLRDDKSFPYIHLTGDSDFPRLTKHRGAQEREGRYYGPFASAGAVNRTLTALQKAFLLRSCSDSVFANRTRPCLLYQIKRCSAPCVGRIDEAAYRGLVAEAQAFLSGERRDVADELAREMQAAAERLDFESAARYRDRIRGLSHIQLNQDVNVEGLEDADVVALHQEGGRSCVQVFFYRAGRNYGNRAYFPSHDPEEAGADLLTSFLAQFYEGKPVPPLVLVSEEPAEKALLTDALSRKAGRRIDLQRPQRGAKRKLLDGALTNAREALARRLADTASQRSLLEGLAERLGLAETPERVEVYDNSHVQGSNPYGAMIVAGPDGFVKSAYRKFAIRKERQPAAEGQTDGTAAPAEVAGDDYAMMRQVLTRRFARALKEDPDRSGGSWPDLVLLDGGRGQLNVADEVFTELGLEDLAVAAVAKGPERDAGRERIFLPGRPPMLLEPRDPVLYFIQRLRDEAHRFVIGTHRAGRTKSRLRSALDDVPGVGGKRKRALLLHFGSAKAVQQAGLADLEAVEGISRTVARKIYDHFHG